MHAKEPSYKFGGRVMVYMPTDMAGKDRNWQDLTMDPTTL